MLPARPEVLVVATLHGSGSTQFLAALGEHPCVVSAGEPFSSGFRFYQRSGELAYYERANDTRLGLRASRCSKRFFEGKFGLPNPKLQIATSTPKFVHSSVSGTRLRTQQPAPPAEQFDSTLLLAPNGTSFGRYMRHARHHLCRQVRLPQQCGGKCTLAFKLFPDYVDSRGDLVRDMLLHTNASVVHLVRSDELARQQSNWRRFQITEAAGFRRGQHRNTSLPCFRKDYVRPESALWGSAPRRECVFVPTEDNFTHPWTVWLRKLRKGASNRWTEVAVDRDCWGARATYVECARSAFNSSGLGVPTDHFYEFYINKLSWKAEALGAEHSRG